MAQKMGGVMDKIKNGNGGMGTHGIIIILTISAEEIGSFFMFECPCNSSNKVYGLSYLFGPMILLLIGGIWMQPGYWKLVTGLLYRKRIRYTNLKEAKSRSNLWEKICIINNTLFQCVSKAMAAPIAWIMVGLLKGENLTCAMWPTDPNEFPDCVTNSTFALPCQIPKTYETDITTCDAIFARNLRSQSHLYAWIGIVSMFGIGLLLLTIRACVSSFTFHQQTFIDSFKKAESKIMNEKLVEKAGKVAVKVVDEFLENKPTKSDWEEVSLIQTTAQHITDGVKDNYHLYSPLHAWATAKMTRENNDETTFIFDLVDDHYEENLERKKSEKAGLLKPTNSTTSSA